MKKYLILILLTLISCTKNPTLFQTQYEKYKNDILPTLKIEQDMTDEVRNEALKIFTSKYKNMDPKEYLRSDEMKKLSQKKQEKALKDIAIILIISNYKTELSDLKRLLDANVIDKNTFNEDIKMMDENLNTYLLIQNIDKIPKDNPVNDSKKDLDTFSYLKMLREELGV